MRNTSVTSQVPDDFTDYEWDGPEDDDEEIEELAALKTQWEIDSGIKFSKNGLVEFIENFVANECTEKQEAWEDRNIKVNGLKVFLKKGGSDISADQPFFRSDAVFPRPY